MFQVRGLARIGLRLQTQRTVCQGRGGREDADHHARAASPVGGADADLGREQADPQPGVAAVAEGLTHPDPRLIVIDSLSEEFQRRLTQSGQMAV